MENTFLLILNYLKIIFSNRFGIYVIAVTVCLFILISVVEIILVYGYKLKVNIIKLFSAYAFCISATIMASVIELSNHSPVFINFIDVFLLNGGLVIIGCFNFFILSFSCYEKPKKVIENYKKLEVDEPKILATKSVEYLSCVEEGQTVYSGYLDVGYLKNLTIKLKEQNLTESESEKVEELELYLLNFVSRQPSLLERQVLSERLSEFIKILSRYNVA